MFGTDWAPAASRSRAPALVLGALHGCGRAVHVPSGTPVAARQPPGPAPHPPTLLPPQVAFDRYEVVTDSAERQTVLTGFLLGGLVAELAVVSVDEHDGRRLRIYAFAGSAWRPSLDIALGPEVRFVDIANIGGEDRLVTYESGRLSWLDPKRGTGSCSWRCRPTLSRRGPEKSPTSTSRET